MRHQIKYKAGYKYQLWEDYVVQTGIRGHTCNTRFLSLSPSGLLLNRAGYAWDGPSGPTIDTPDFMRGSLVHDALYQLVRMGLLPYECKLLADVLLYDICRADGMWTVRAWWVYRAVDAFGGPACRNPRPVLTAP